MDNPAARKRSHSSPFAAKALRDRRHWPLCSPRRERSVRKASLPEPHPDGWHCSSRARRCDGFPPRLPPAEEARRRVRWWPRRELQPQPVSWASPVCVDARKSWARLTRRGRASIRSLASAWNGGFLDFASRRKPEIQSFTKHRPERQEQYPQRDQHPLALRFRILRQRVATGAASTAPDGSRAGLRLET